MPVSRCDDSTGSIMHIWLVVVAFGDKAFRLTWNYTLRYPDQGFDNNIDQTTDYTVDGRTNQSISNLKKYGLGKNHWSICLEGHLWRSLFWGVFFPRHLFYEILDVWRFCGVFGRNCYAKTLRHQTLTRHDVLATHEPSVSCPKHHLLPQISCHELAGFDISASPSLRWATRLWNLGFIVLATRGTRKTTARTTDRRTNLILDPIGTPKSTQKSIPHLKSDGVWWFAQGVWIILSNVN